VHSKVALLRKTGKVSVLEDFIKGEQSRFGTFPPRHSAVVKFQKGSKYLGRENTNHKVVVDDISSWTNTCEILIVSFVNPVTSFS